MHRRSPLVACALLLGGALLACTNPFGEDPPPATDAADVVTPPEPPAEEPPPGGWIKDGVIYDKDGTVYGCVGGGNSCAGPPAGIVEPSPEDLDLCGNVDAIRDAELDWHDRKGSYLAVPPTPRPADQVNETAVTWPARSGFAELGWAPGGPTRATYWVDVADGGFEVHGLASAGSGFTHCYASATQGAVDTPWRPR